jgi:hypothetical protein
MKSKLFVLFALLFAFTSCNIYSQNGWGRGSNYNKIYDVNTVETISGQVTKIDKIYPDKGMSYGIHMILSTSAGDVSVHLGPGWFIENQDILISTDDNVTVTGSKVTYEGSKVIIAKEVTKGDQVLKLRDDNGYPLWSGWRNK